MWQTKLRKHLIPSPDSDPPRPDVSDPPGESVEHALVGESHVFKGEVSGDQDLTINGRFEGTVSLSGHTVTVGRSGRVQGDIVARVIRINGHVEGNLQGEEVVFLGPTAVVHGDLTTVRVSMDEGCAFNGHVLVAAKPHSANELTVPLSVRTGHRTNGPATSKRLTADGETGMPLPVEHRPQ